MDIDIETLAGLVSFAALMLVWVVAPTKPAHETMVKTAPVASPREALA